MSGQKIKIDADLSSFNEQIRSLNNTLSQLGNKLKTESGKADLKLDGPKKQLKEILEQTEKLTAALDKTDKKSEAYAKNLKEAAKAMSEAAKLAQKLEKAGGSSNANASNYFNEHANNLGDEAASEALQRSQDRAQQQLENDRVARNASFRDKAIKIAGMVGGSVMGGGGGYASLGSTVGGLLPGPWGVAGSIVGGMVGGFADKTIGGNKEEALKYSELHRSLGVVNTDFEALRATVRSTTEGFGVTNVEASKLALSFAKSAGLSEDYNSDISKSVGTATAFAQSYALDPTQVNGFQASMRLNGVTHSDNDNKRLALQIGEAVGRVGMSSKMEEVLGSINNFVSSSTAQSLSSTGQADFTSILTGLVGSSYNGLHGNVGNAANLINTADSGVRGGGSRGEASQYQWLVARNDAFRDMSWLDNSSMQEMGALGDISAPYKAGSPLYDNAPDEEKARRDRVAKSIAESGYRTNLQLGLDRAKSLSNGNYNSEIMNIKGMFGVNSDEQAAALKQFGSNYQGQGELEKAIGQKLSAISMNKIGAYAEVVEGNDDQRKAYYKNIKKNLSGDDVARGDKALEEGGESLKRFLIDAITKTDQSDPGLDAQKTSVELQNKMASSLSGLVEIETEMKEILLGIWKGVDSDSDALKHMMGADRSSNGVDVNGDNAYRKKDVVEAVSKINAATSMDEKKKIASRLLDIYDRQKQTGFPTDTEKLVEEALYPPENKIEKTLIPEEKNGESTLPVETKGAGNYRKIADLANGPQNDVYQKIVDEANRQGVPVEQALALARKESNFDGNALGPIIKKGKHKGDRAVGTYQFMGSSALGWDRFNVDENISHGISDLKRNYKKFHDWGLADAAHHAGANSIKNGQIPDTTDGYSTTRDYVNDIQRYASDYMDDMPKQKSDNTQSFKHSIDINLFDSDKQPIADKFTVAFNSYIGAPKAAGLAQ